MKNDDPWYYTKNIVTVGTMDIATAFICTNYNKYSVNALAGAVESTPATQNAHLYFITEHSPVKILEALTELQRSHEMLLIGFSFATTNAVAVYELLSMLKADLAGGRALYIAGGPHASGDPSGALAMGFDITVIGEGEETFPELINALTDDLDWRAIRGIAYHDGESVVTTGRRRPVDLNRFAPFSPSHERLSPIEVSRGCPHACRFCQTSFLFGARMRHRALDEVLGYISLSKVKGTKDFRFISPNALAYGSEDGISVNLEAIEGLLRGASAIVGTDHLFFGSFPSEVRPEAVSPEAIELITRFTATRQIVIGAQTGSQRMLDSLHREHNVEDVDRAIECILAAGLEVCVDFIFGLPGETNDDRLHSIAMMDSLAARGAKIHSHTFIPLPGTPLAKEDVGVIDKELAAYLSRLANKGLQFGQWKKQQRLAREASHFLLHLHHPLI